MASTRLFSVSLSDFGPVTERTRHYKEGAPLAPPAALEIVRFDHDPGFFLYYLDRNGEPQTDTWHQRLEDAFEQAQFEFGVQSTDWRKEAN